MSNFRAPANIFLSTLHKAHYCSGSSEKTGQELLKQVQVVVEDKIKPEKLKNLLPNVQHRENEITSFKLAEEQVTVTNSDNRNTEQSTNELVCDSRPVHKASDQLITINLSEKILPPEGFTQKLASCNIHGTLKDIPQLTETPEILQDPPQSLPAFIVTKEKTETIDLSHAMLPLSLHLNDKNNLLVEAVIQDFKHVYFKTSSTIDGWNMVARTQGKAFYTTAEKIMKDPSSIQHFLREQIVSISTLKNKDGFSVFDPKAVALAIASGPSIVDKIKTAIGNIIESIKQLLNQQSKSTGEKKKKEEKKGEEGGKSKE